MAKKTKPKQPTPNDENIDLGTPELRKHFEIEMIGEGSKKRARVLNHPLDRYYVRNEITLDQYRAGCTLFRDYSVSHVNKNTLSLLGAQSGVYVNIDFDNPHTAFERYMRAVKTLSLVSRLLAFRVCIEGRSLKEVHSSFGWRKKNTGIDRLGETLDELARFYIEEYKARNDYIDRKNEQQEILVD